MALTSKSYGATRDRRPSVSYGEVERAATALLKSGQRPTIDKLRKALGGGAPDTITNALSRFWKDLGARIEGDPASLSRLPAEVADLADTVWGRALALAAEAASQRMNSDREKLEFFKRENELRAHAISLKEKELDALLRSRERTIVELETHLRAALGFVQQREESIRALEARTKELETEAKDQRRRLANLIGRAVTPNRAVRGPKQRPARARGKSMLKLRLASKSSASTPRAKGGPRRVRR